MYRFFTFASLMLLLSAVAGSTEIIQTDGVWWNSLDEHDKAIAMFAATNAYNAGYGVGSLAQSRIDFDRETARDIRFSTANEVKRELGWYKKYAQSHPSSPELPGFSGKTMGSYMAGITYFYSNHPDKSELNFAHVLRCIADKPDKTCDQVAKEGF